MAGANPERPIPEFQLPPDAMMKIACMSLALALTSMQNVLIASFLRTPSSNTAEILELLLERCVQWATENGLRLPPLPDLGANS
jgi:hypothetical protein